MIEEAKIEQALAVGLGQIQPSARLLDRIHGVVDQLESTVPSARQSRWPRLQLRSMLELAVACVLVASLVGAGAYRHLHLPPAPAGDDQGRNSRVTPPEASTLSGLPLPSEVTKAYFGGYPGAGARTLDQSTVTRLLTWLGSAPVVAMEDEIFFNHGRDFYLVMERQSGDQIMVRPAADCVVTKSADGTRTTCQKAEGYVNVITAGTEAPRLYAPEVVEWLKGQAAHPAPPSPAAGAADLSLSGIQATFAAPLAPATITPEEAKAITAEHLGQPPAEVKVTVEYLLMSLPESTYDRNWVNEPVYLVTYDGITMAPSSGPMPQGPAPTPNPDAKGKVTAIIDAETGDWIMAVAR